MGRIKTATLSRHTAPPFLIVAGLELMQLRKVRPLARCMFYELLAMADHATGRVSTSYAVLAALLDFDADPCAHPEPEPTTKRLRTALDDLVKLGLVRVDRVANEKRQGLFLRVPSRVGIATPDADRGRVRGRVANRKKPEESNTSPTPRPNEGQGEGQGVQENSLPPSPPLSTGTQAVGELLRETKRRIVAARGENRAPKGA